MPYKKNLRCRVCRKAIRGTKGHGFAARMAKVRHHYKTKHPVKWRQSIKRGVAKRRFRR